MPCYSPLEGYKDPETGGFQYRRENTKEKMTVPCGGCIGCRLDRARHWTARLIHESHCHPKNTFITLTYDNLNLPENGSLDLEHLQKFMKRMRRAREVRKGRKVLHREKIKYYAVGEYGYICPHGIDISMVPHELCNHGRPHYHIALFNCAFDVLLKYEDASDQRPKYFSPELKELWPYGNNDVTELNPTTAMYAAGYITKKVTGKNAEDHYRRIGPHGEICPIKPEFNVMSRGLGKEWFEKYHADCYPSDQVPIPSAANPRVENKPPRYYDNLLEKSDPELLDLIKRKRAKRATERPEEHTRSCLHDRYKVKMANVKMRKGSL